MHLLKHPFGRELLIVAVHLPSKLYQTDDDQAFYARRLSEEISEQEKEIGHNRTMVIGDFNMDPFETGMILADGLHAVMDKNIAKDRNRNVRGKSYPLFYNPMWSRLGVTIQSALPAHTFIMITPRLRAFCTRSFTYFFVLLSYSHLTLPISTYSATLRNN